MRPCRYRSRPSSQRSRCTWQLPYGSVGSTRRAAQIPMIEVEDLLPAIHGLLLPIARPFDREEAVPGPVVTVKLIAFPELLQLFLGPVHVHRGWVLVLVAKDTQ